ncbi:zonadhesin-like, partial [Stegodyphus dumicola]|uniref:zonadhesin-like n=1 Tax=Stegodyphus dumicola TaxID=202533 RepID=UPI0015AC2548
SPSVVAGLRLEKALFKKHQYNSPYMKDWCGENEHYEHCGPNCPDTCKNYKDVHKPCLRRCVKGCFCNEGYVKAGDGNCVKPENCLSSIKTLCHKNEHYEYCGTGCPSICENQEITHKSCSERCVAGCFCNKGYVKAEDGRCIKNEHCAFQEENCPENQHFRACGTPCLYTCEKFQNRRKRCLERCVPDCFCDIGFLKTEDGRCVRRENCPVRKLTVDCPENEHFEECGSAYPTTCDNSEDFERPEVEMCVKGCFCNKGFLKDENGQCVTPENCPRVCKQQKQSGPCTLRIQRFYFNNKTRQCEIFIYGGCLGNRNNFMTKQQCEATCVECPEKQHFEVCSSPCVFSCEKYRDPSKVCLEKCVSGCFCDKGYLKTKDGRYVKPENCPLRILSACQQRRQSGPCRHIFHRFYFNNKTRKCELFIYGGCHGNKNNFRTRKLCENTCVG